MRTLKTMHCHRWIVLVALLASSNLAQSATPLGSGFTYQGRLTQGGSPAQGNYAMRFTLWDAATGGTVLTMANSFPSVEVNSGWFTATLDFGSEVLNGQECWLELSVGPAGADTLTTLSPRQRLSAVPYASYATKAGSAIPSGLGTTASGNATIALGDRTRASGVAATAMGSETTALEDFATAMGVKTTATGYASTAMGIETRAMSDGAVALGERTGATAAHAFAVGFNSTASGPNSMALGTASTASGPLAVAMGFRAQAQHDGSFVWADHQDADFSSTAPNQFLVRASGGVQMDTAASSLQLSTRSLEINSGRGISLNAHDGPLITRGWDAFDASAGPDKAGLGRWGLFMERMHINIGMPEEASVGTRWFNVSAYAANGERTDLFTVVNNGFVICSANLAVMGEIHESCDRNMKENIESIDPKDVLEKITALPLSKWSYKRNKESRHIGPMAQDFKAAFGLGSDDKSICTVDADGVALAAIQGLNQKLEAKNAALESRLAAKDVEIQALQTKAAQVDELQQRLGEIESLLRRLASPESSEVH